MRHHFNYIANVQRNKVMWEKWVEMGVQLDSMLEVDFFFTTYSRAAVDALTRELQKSSGQVSISAQRHWLRKLYYIQITLPKDTWTLTKLNKITEYYCNLCLKISPKIVVDGCGASMP